MRSTLLPITNATRRPMISRSVHPLLLMLIGTTAAIFLGQGSLAAHAQTRQLIETGRAIVTLNCARCHAVEKSGTSPFPQAPPFRTLSTKYPIEHLAEALAEGILSGHPAMPEFIFNPDEIDAILAYLEALSEQR